MQTESMIELLKQTLKFYAEEKNYSRGIVEKDGGHQARHILDLIHDNENKIKSYETMFDEFEQKTIENDNLNVDDFIKLIDELKKID